jgi:hypothetical protein
MPNRARRRAVAICAAVWSLSFPAAAQSPVIDRLDAIGEVLDLCVTRQLAGQGFSPTRDVTLRLSFRRDGSIIGVPTVTYSRPSRNDTEQVRFIAAMTAAFRNCTPLPFSKQLGAAIAGAIFNFRYTLKSSKDVPL